MSKSPNIFLPALGITGIVLGAAYGVSTRSYKAEEAQAALMQAEAANTRASEALAAKAALQEQVETIQTELAARPIGGATVAQPAPVSEVGLGLGRPAMAEEIAAWDVDVRPDGVGLPVGSGDALIGEALFEENCAICHGSFAEGVDNWPKLAGGDGTLADEDPLKTVGSYWPYLSTVWDYVNRSMPFGNAQSLSADEVYAITAYILYSNDMVDDDFVLSNETFLDVEMPNSGGFIVDNRADTEYSIWSNEPCMSDCKPSVEITMRAMVLDVTPEDVTETPMAETQTAIEEPAADPVEAVAEAPAADPELVAAGEKVFKKCNACHQVGANAKNRSGPVLNGVIGRTVGAVDGFKYSNTFVKLAEAGTTWTAESMSMFLRDPKAFAKGTKMSFKGLKKPEDLEAITAYLATFPE